MHQSYRAHSCPFPPVFRILRQPAYLRLAVLVAGLLVVQTRAPAFADDTDSPASGAVTSHDVQVGIGGVLKAGRWAEARLTVGGLSGSTAALRVTATDAEGQLAEFVGSDVAVSANGSATLTALFQVGRLDRPLTLKVLSEGRTVEQTVLRPSLTVSASTGNDALSWQVARPEELLVASVGQPVGMAAASEDASRAASGVRHIPLNSVTGLPVHAAGYESLDALILCLPATSGTGTQNGPSGPTAYEPGEVQADALRRWVAAGGHLIVSVALEVERLNQSPLADWLPVTLGETPASQRDLAGLESFSRRNELIVIRGRVPAARIDSHDGRVLVNGLDGPLIVQSAYGNGRVTVIGLDLNRSPLVEWAPQSALLRRLIQGGQAQQQDSDSGSSSQLTRAGITDLKTQWHASQEWFPEVHRPATWTVMGLILLYVVVIGPLDWLVVHKLLRRPWLTWLTFPLATVLVTGAAWWYGNRQNDQPLSMNQYDVVDIDARLGELRGRSWFSLYSPDSRRYALEAEPAAWGTNASAEVAGADESSSHATGETVPLAHTAGGGDTAAPSTALAGEPLRLGWSGIPETGYGGMYREGGLNLVTAGYRLDVARGRIGNLPLPVWSTRSCRAEWTAHVPDLVESSLSSSAAGQLAGTIRHHLPGEIEDWVIAYGRRAYLPVSRDSDSPASRIRPGQTWSPGQSIVRQRELAGFLTGTRATRVAGKRKTDDTVQFSQEVYQPLNREPADIIRVLTFHSVTGGRDYTGLTNHELRKLDLTELLSLNRAVLFGRLRLPASRILVDGTPMTPARHAGFVRIVLPVRQARPERTELPDFDD